ncbi:polyprenyl synthetase family protein [Cellulomonas fimi]|uniref:Polyprenyl synthetase family protein n=1 Tax=Cellulomonas fimi TaxID=1708 RepID=A0A7Y0LW99_CELFI|nr:polyprenyl synthetase family protein [Cellulomonas fimi]NMR19089.1 polyprenyl synthetase family protein [Cellulomonas fimi]
MSPPASDDALTRYFAEGLARSVPFDPDYQQLWASLAEAGSGGKRFRPALVAAVYTSLGGTDSELCGCVGAAIELLHTAFVIHDDVIDGDDVRRGRLNVSGTFAARALAAGVAPDRGRVFGHTAGILAGDLALVGATRLIALCGAPATTTRRLLDLLDHAVYVTAAGELADVRLSLGVGEVSLGDIVTVEEHKTAVYSFELPLQAGAILAGADDDVVLGLSELGRLVGIAFQLLDDLQGTFGDEAVTGKSALTDLREGKVTPLIAHARTTSVWPEVAASLGSRDLTEAEADGVRALLVAAGSRQFVEELADAYVDAALDVATRLELPTAFLDWITAMTDELTDRAA